MLLRGREGDELGLSLVGYRFPDEAVDPWDSNQLLVALRVVAPHGSWEVVDPCLTTWEASRLAAWLEAVAARAGSPVSSTLAEPNVTVSATVVAPGRVGLTICFELERRPPWAPTVAGGGDLCVDLEVSAGDLAAAGRHLRSDLRRFPRRGADPTL